MSLPRIAVLGAEIEAMEAGSAVRHQEGATVTVGLAPDVCWAYPAG